MTAVEHPDRPGAQRWVPAGAGVTELRHAAVACRGCALWQPDLGQMVACRPWLDAELQAVDPELIVPLGATAVRSLLGPDVRVTKQRGQLLVHGTSIGDRRFVPTVHPSSILRGPSSAREEGYAALVADLRAAASVLSH